MGIVKVIKGFFLGDTEEKGRPYSRMASERRSLQQILNQVSDENLKEVVKSLLDMDERLLTIWNRTNSQEQELGTARSQIVDLKRRVDAMGFYPRSGEPPGDEKSRSQAKNPERATLEEEIRYIENFLSTSRGVLRLLHKARMKAAVAHLESECGSVIEKVKSRMKKIDPFGASGPDPYRSLFETIHSIRLTDLSLYLFSLAEEEMDGRAENDTWEILRAMGALADSLGFVLIKPKVGDRYDENEHDVIGQERSKGLRAGTIAKIHVRGLKRSSTGAVVKRARISLAM